MDPHDISLADAVYKARGLADFALKHGDRFGRIELIVVSSKGQLKRLDVNREGVREKVKKVENRTSLKALFEE